MASSAHIWFPGLWTGGSWGWAGLRCLHPPGHLLLCQHPSQVGLALAWARRVLMVPRPRPGGPRWGSYARGCRELSCQGRLPLPTRSGALLGGGPWQSDTSPSREQILQPPPVPSPLMPLTRQLPASNSLPSAAPASKASSPPTPLGSRGAGDGCRSRGRNKRSVPSLCPGFCLHDGNTLRLLWGGTEGHGGLERRTAHPEAGRKIPLGRGKSPRVAGLWLSYVSPEREDTG